MTAEERAERLWNRANNKRLFTELYTKDLNAHADEVLERLEDVWIARWEQNRKGTPFSHALEGVIGDLRAARFDLRPGEAWNG